MTTSLRQRAQADLKQALRDGDRIRVSTLRLLISAFQKKEKDERVADLDDAAARTVLRTLLRQYRDAAEQYRKAGAGDRAAKEEAEMQILSSYMPEPLANDELEAMIHAAITETGAATPRDMGKVMALLRDRTQGRADMASVSAKVKKRLFS